MTDSEPPAAVADALEGHEAFEPLPGESEYDLTTTVFDTAVAASAASDEGEADAEFRIVVTLPTLDAAVAGEPVAAAVEGGWFDTLERRLQDVYSVAQATEHADEPAIERDDGAGEVRVALEYVARDAADGVDDAKALIEFVEGTFVQGIVPGYEYRGPTAELLDRARSLGQQPAQQGGDGDTPL